MKKLENTANIWTVCPECKGQGKKSRRIGKKVRLQYQMAVELFEKSNSEGTFPVRPKAHLDSCLNCSGSGLVAAMSAPIPDSEHYPHVAIIEIGRAHV